MTSASKSASRRGAVVSLAAVLVLMVASAGLSACRWRPPAATVNGTEITTEDLRNDLQVLQQHPQVAAQLAGTAAAAALGNPSLNPGVMPFPATASALRFRITEKLIGDAYAASATPLEATLFDERKRQVEEALAGLLDGQPADAATQAYFDRRVLWEVRASALLEGLDEQQAQARANSVLGSGDVRIDPRFGAWDPARFQVVPLGALDPAAPGPGPQA